MLILRFTIFGHSSIHLFYSSLYLLLYVVANCAISLMLVDVVVCCSCCSVAFADYNKIQYNTPIQYNTIQYNTIQYNTTQHNTTQYNTMQYNVIQYNTICGSCSCSFYLMICVVVCVFYCVIVLTFFVSRTDDIVVCEHDSDELNKLAKKAVKREDDSDVVLDSWASILRKFVRRCCC